MADEEDGAEEGHDSSPQAISQQYKVTATLQAHLRTTRHAVPTTLTCNTMGPLGSLLCLSSVLVAQFLCSVACVLSALQGWVLAQHNQKTRVPQG